MAAALEQSWHTTMAKYSLEMGRGWLGNSLKPYGPSPYQPVNDVKDIPETVDTEPVSGHFEFDPGVWTFDHEKQAWVFSEGTPKLYQVNFIRDHIQQLIDALQGNMPVPAYQAECFRNAIARLVEAKMCYGYELDAMRSAVPDNAVEVPLPDKIGPLGDPLDDPDPTPEEMEEAAAPPKKKSKK